jgi:hypothetical protein
MTATQRSKRKASLDSAAELSSASTFNRLPAVDKTSLPKGQTTSMRELVQIDSPSEHACGQPVIERLHVLEPVSGRWSWVRLFGCCNQVIFEPGDEEQAAVKAPARVKRAA